MKDRSLIEMFTEIVEQGNDSEFAFFFLGCFVAVWLLSFFADIVFDVAHKLSTFIAAKMRKSKQKHLFDLSFGDNFTLKPQFNVSSDVVYCLVDHSLQLNRLIAIRLSDGVVYSFEPDTLVYTDFRIVGKERKSK